MRPCTKAGVTTPLPNYAINTKILNNPMNNFTSRPFDLALSGGGFRAAFFQIGALIALGKLGHLGSIRRISAVSGGAFAALHYAEKFHELRNSASPSTTQNEIGTQASIAAYAALSAISAKDPRTSALLDTSFLLNSLDKKTFFLGRSVERQFKWKAGHFSHLPFEVILNTVKLENREIVGHQLIDTDDVGGWLAAATALPGVFEPRAIDGTQYVDAGIVDKTGVQSLLAPMGTTGPSVQILCIDASQGMTLDTKKAVSAGFAMQKLLEFSAEEGRLELIDRQDVELVSLRDDEPCWHGVRNTIRAMLADIRTDLDYFTPVEAAALAYAGYHGTIKKFEPALDPLKALDALQAQYKQNPKTHALTRTLSQMIDVGGAMTKSDVGGDSLETVLAMGKRLMFRQMTSDNSFLRTIGWFFAICLTAYATGVAMLITITWLLTLIWLIPKFFTNINPDLAILGSYILTCVPIYLLCIRRGESRASLLTRTLAFLLCPVLFCSVISLRLGRSGATASPSIGSLKHKQRPSGWVAELFSWPDPDRAPGNTQTQKKLNIALYFVISTFLLIFLVVNPIKAAIHFNVVHPAPILQLLSGSWLGAYSNTLGWVSPIVVIFFLCEIYMRAREGLKKFSWRSTPI
ncbi:hypothetical protein BLA6863_01846 [Burkholderia lata]|uniref:PNPLA domain-containing protein n=2 Tax=Burkholderia TaxID=32008 RepID=A0A6P2JFN8_BURL3|nr:hypothetical protein BLA6863_01846 [Burkholderia lata]